MTLAMAAVGDLVSPRQRGRYQGYIAATFALATVVGPLIGGLLVQQVSWRWVFYVNLPLGLLALAGLRLRLPAGAAEPPRTPLDVSGALLLAGSTTAVTLTCIWGGSRYPWGSATIIGLLAGAAALAVALVVRERRAADPIVPVRLLATRTVAVSSAALFLTTAALFSITVFVPLYLQTTTHATPTQAGLLLVPAMLGIAVSTNLAGRAIERTGRYKRYPLIGLALMAAALGALAALASHPSQTATAITLAVFGLGFGMVGQVLIVAVQNGVDRRQLGIAMATTSFFRGLGGAIGAAVLGAVFSARTGTIVSTGAGLARAGMAARSDVIAGVQAVFLVAAPIALVALILVLGLEEVPLRPGPGPEPAPRRPGPEAPARPRHGGSARSGARGPLSRVDGLGGHPPHRRAAAGASARHAKRDKPAGRSELCRELHDCRAFCATQEPARAVCHVLQHPRARGRALAGRWGG